MIELYLFFCSFFSSLTLSAFGCNTIMQLAESDRVHKNVVVYQIVILRMQSALLLVAAICYFVLNKTVFVFSIVKLTLPSCRTSSLAHANASKAILSQFSLVAQRNFCCCNKFRCIWFFSSVQIVSWHDLVAWHLFLYTIYWTLITFVFNKK